MVLKCCVTLFKGNYACSSERVPVYQLPQDEEEKKKSVSVIPRANLVVLKCTAACGKHWPNDAEMVKVHGKLRSKNPPSVFYGILSSCLSSQLSNSCKAFALWGNEYVKLERLSTGPLEKAFEKLQQGLKRTYFIMAQAVIEKDNIHHAKLFLQLGVNLSQDSTA